MLMTMTIQSPNSMSATGPLQIGFRISNIETLQFAMFEEQLGEGALSYTVGFSFGVDVEEKMIRSVFKYDFKCEQRPVLTIETAIDFAIEENGFKSLLKQNKELVLPHGLAAHFATLVVGTARGILFEKTKSSALAKFHMPTINVTESVFEDMIFALD